MNDKTKKTATQIRVHMPALDKLKAGFEKAPGKNFSVYTDKVILAGLKALAVKKI